jgi:hypothetical protein
VLRSVALHSRRQSMPQYRPKRRRYIVVTAFAQYPLDRCGIVPLHLQRTDAERFSVDRSWRW